MLKHRWPPGTLVRYRTIKDPGLFRLKNNILYVYGIILRIDPRSKDNDEYYNIFWITKIPSGIRASAIFTDANGLKAIGFPK